MYRIVRRIKHYSLNTVSIHSFSHKPVLLIRSLNRFNHHLVSSTPLSTSSFNLSYSLFFLGSASIYYSVSLTFYSGYVLLFDESTLIALCVHHQWIGGLFLVGAFTHFAIAVVRIDWHTLVLDIFNVLSMNSDIILGHLSWVVTFLGINAFGLYVHNDTLLALNRIPDTFSDAAIASEV